MPHSPGLLDNPPPMGQEVIFERMLDHVLFNGVRQEDGTWTMSLDNEDTTFDPATVGAWFHRA
jgi:hypothetical protein